jgi:hypothetical protein
MTRLNETLIRSGKMFSVGKQSDLDENWSQRTKESKRDSGLGRNQRHDSDTSSTNTIEDIVGGWQGEDDIQSVIDVSRFLNYLV